MNRKNLTAAVLAGLAGAAGIAGTAQAVNLNPDGLGQVLIYPYYTTNDGNDTLLSVVNTTDSAKAVKVRFKEGYNSREVLDFNMYMSAYDVWAAAIINGGEVAINPLVLGTPVLVIPDSTCTVPYLYQQGIDAGYPGGFQEFLDYDYTGTNSDGGPTGISRAAEGYFEMIEMGTLTNETAKAATATTARVLGSAEAATHFIDEDGVQSPLDCQQLNDNWSNLGGGIGKGMWLEDETLDIARNSGGLFGGAAIINVQKGTMHAYDAKAVQGYDSKSDGNHFRPGNSHPNLNDGNEYTATVFFGVPQNKAVTLNYGSADRSVDAISAVFMHEYTMNEFNVKQGNKASSEWVLTFPTKRWYVDVGLFGEELKPFWVPNQNDPDCDFWDPVTDTPTAPPRSGPTYNESTDPPEDSQWELCSYVQSGVDTSGARPPFTELFNGSACEVYSMRMWDREENAAEGDDPDQGPIVSPPPPGGSTPSTPNVMCYEVNILRFGNAENSPAFKPVFGTTSDLVSDVPTGLITYDLGTKFKIRESGWARIDWGFDSDHVDEEGLVGLPVTGFWAEQFTNGTLTDNAGE